MFFTFCLVGWEGSASDATVLRDARGKGDGGYTFALWLLTPCCGVNYHLKEWAEVGKRLRTREELFNLRRANHRNMIELMFRVFKKRPPLIVNFPKHVYSFSV